MPLWIVILWCIIVFTFGYFAWIILERLIFDNKFEKGKRLHEAAAIISSQMNHNIYFIDNDLDYSKRFTKLNSDSQRMLKRALMDIVLFNKVKSLILVDTTDKTVVGKAKYNFENDTGQVIKQEYGITLNHWL